MIEGHGALLKMPRSTKPNMQFIRATRICNGLDFEGVLKLI
jgi:hypothetical protein